MREKKQTGQGLGPAALYTARGCEGPLGPAPAKDRGHGLRGRIWNEALRHMPHVSLTGVQSHSVNRPFPVVEKQRQPLHRIPNPGTANVSLPLQLNSCETAVHLGL